MSPRYNENGPVRGGTRVPGLTFNAYSGGIEWLAKPYAFNLGATVRNPFAGGRSLIRRTPTSSPSNGP